ncbi:winged helix-turn-helix transcriptional regulator [Streptomyces sp. NPDC058469]|uniref:winged helix-turn-helix transcriptional regulator n=1 Tax=Streptomyces sp. NPDC058469 TaxID=3346514 RepID=UPI00364FA9D2
MLTQTLRTLEHDGLVLRTVYPEVPTRVEYELTPLGQTLRGPLRALTEWSGGTSRKSSPPVRSTTAAPRDVSTATVFVVMNGNGRRPTLTARHPYPGQGAADEPCERARPTGPHINRG